MRPFFLVSHLFFFATLGGCSCGSDLAAGGPTPYVRCAMMEPPAPRDLSIGGVHLTVAERAITLEAESPRIVVARGAGGAGEPLLPVLDAIEAASPSVVILLGDHGDGEGLSESSLAAMVADFGQLNVPVLFLPGGRDAGPALREALPDDGALIDLGGVRSVRIGGLELVPLPGAPSGRYAVDESACGLGSEDLSAIASDVGSADGLRLVLSYAAPATGDARTAGLEGVEAGAPLIAEALTALGARGGLYAFPEAEIGRPFDGTSRATVPTGALETLHLVVPRLLGPATFRSDGSRQVSGVVVLEVRTSPTGEVGVAVVSVP